MILRNVVSAESRDLLAPTASRHVDQVSLAKMKLRGADRMRLLIWNEVQNRSSGTRNARIKAALDIYHKPIGMRLNDSRQSIVLEPVH